MANVKEVVTTRQFAAWDTAITGTADTVLYIAPNAHLVQSAIEAGMIEGAEDIDDLNYAEIVALANELTKRVKDWTGAPKKTKS